MSLAKAVLSIRLPIKGPRSGMGLRLFTLMAVLALPSLAGQTASAQVGLSHAHPNLARGSGNATTESYPWDSVNLFNGNLNISLPVGIKYPLSGEFGYQFNLTYNSNAWDLDQPSSSITATPVRNANAGFGWDLSFGRLIPPVSNGAQTGRWVYVSPDGGLHPFYSTLHHDLSENDPGELTSYTRDGTYYRMRLVGADQAVVESPDGTQTIFRLIGGEWSLSQINDRFNNRLSSVIFSSPSMWMLSDNHGRQHRVYFKPDPSGYYPRIIDRIELAAFNGTVATYTFAYTTAAIARPSVDNDPATPASVNLPLLESITHPDGSKQLFTYHPAGAAADSHGRLASMRLPTMGKIEWTYQSYKYTTGANPSALGPAFRQNTGVATRRMINMSGGVDGVWTYTPSLQPSGSEEREMTNTVKTPLGDKTVHYFSVNTLGNGSGWARSDYGLPFTKSQFDRPGSLAENVALASNGASATASSTFSNSYPASGAIDGDRRGLNWGSGGGWNDATGNAFPDSIEVSFGGSKTIDSINVYTLQDNYSDNPVEPTPETTFTQFGIQDFDVQYWNGAAWATVPGGHVVGNDKVWRRFTFPQVTTGKIRVVVNRANSWSRIVEVEAFELAAAADARFLSKQVFDCDSDGNNCQLMRSTYVRYQQDQATDPASSEVASVNRREVSNRTVYHDDVENGVARFADSDKSNFDGLGHFRQIATDGNFGSGDVRSYFLNYDAATGSYPSTGYSMPSPSAPWVLNTVSQQKIIEGQSMQVIEFCYDRNNGFLTRTRRWSATSPSAGAASSNDVITVYTPDASGQIAREQYYGGDVQPVGTTSLCALVLPATDQYRVQHTYQFGRRSSSQFHTASGAPFGPKHLNQTIDRNTGMASVSLDVAGIATSYEYDAMGRQTWVKPEAGHGAWRQITYVAALNNDYAKKLTYDKTNGGASALTYDADVYDSFGRVWWQQTSVPGSYPNRYRFYNAMGLMTHQSEFSNGAPKYTEFWNHDPFGRARLIRPPEGAHHDVTFEFAGVRSVKRTTQTGVYHYPVTGQIVEAPKDTREVYDRQGRLWQHITYRRLSTSEPTRVVTSSYDAAGHVIASRMNGALVGDSHFYDGRGFLFMSQSPDTTARSFTSFDARGNALKQRHHLTDLSYIYDRAGRLTRVQDSGDASKVWKEFVYADSNGVNDWRAGKLWSTKRYNYVPPNVAPAVVSEVNTYGGSKGRLSRYEVEITDGIHAAEKYAQTYTYDELGNVKDLGYPNSIAAGGNMGRDRTATYDYAVGYLTSVTGTLNGQAESWAAPITYHANGLVSSLAHSNGVTDNIAGDTNDRARVLSISTTGVKSLPRQGDRNFYSGNFQYDGAGNVVKIGAQAFLPEENQQPPAPSTPPAYSTSCPNAWFDPFKLAYGAVGDGGCFPWVVYFYTAGDRVLKVEDRRSSIKTLHFTDLKGRTITESTAVATSGSWLSTRDFIYGKDSLVGVSDAMSAAPFFRTFHITKGHGAAGVITDKDGYRTELDLNQN